MKHNTHSHIPAHERSPLHGLPLFPDTKTDVPCDEIPIAVEIARLDIGQLMGSPRGKLALLALCNLLTRESTWSLDALNQGALTRLLEGALISPSVRELVVDTVRAAQNH